MKTLIIPTLLITLLSTGPLSAGPELVSKGFVGAWEKVCQADLCVLRQGLVFGPSGPDGTINLIVSRDAETTLLSAVIPLPLDVSVPPSLVLSGQDAAGSVWSPAYGFCQTGGCPAVAEVDVRYFGGEEWVLRWSNEPGKGAALPVDMSGIERAAEALRDDGPVEGPSR